MTKPTGNPVGRPSSYSEETADKICEGLLDGLSLVDVCADPAMPHRVTVYRWMAEDADFAARMARAREGQGEYMDHKILQLAEKCTPETAPADRVRLAAYQWRARHLAPRRYGEKITQENVGPDGGPMVMRWLTAAEPTPDA